MARTLRNSITTVAVLVAGAAWGAEKTADEVADLLPDADDQNGTAVIFQPVFPFPIGDTEKPHHPPGHHTVCQSTSVRKFTWTPVIYNPFL